MARKIIVTSPGTCGELIQGWLGDSQKLVSLGMNKFTTVTIEASKTASELQLTPHKSKSYQALLATCDFLKIDVARLDNLKITISSELSCGKGMSSSTADIAGCIYGLALYFGRRLTVQEVVNLCVPIEATDSVIFPSLTLFEQQTGSLMIESNWRPNFYMLVLEPAASLNTADFHTQQIERSFYQQKTLFKQVHQKYQQAAANQDLKLLGEAATASACLNQSILEKPYFESLKKLVGKHHLMGINVAHSGTVVGLLMEDLISLTILVNQIRNSAIGDYYKHLHLQRTCFDGLKAVIVDDK